MFPFPANQLHLDLLRSFEIKKNLWRMFQTIYYGLTVGLLKAFYWTITVGLMQTIFWQSPAGLFKTKLDNNWVIENNILYYLQLDSSQEGSSISRENEKLETLKLAPTLYYYLPGFILKQDFLILILCPWIVQSIILTETS